VLRVDDLAVGLVIPEDLKLLALRVVVGAGERDDWRAWALGVDGLDEPVTRAQADELTWLGESIGQPGLWRLGTYGSPSLPKYLFLEPTATRHYSSAAARTHGRARHQVIAHVYCVPALRASR
jgi:hypothetical protein